ncbi:hypothetical protein [Limnohabitans sp.]|uniref:hypothetical protein n=1 Tax=Limnohabitans sp. TaxID=1907725 RepID=UPI003340F049
MQEQEKHGLHIRAALTLVCAMAYFYAYHLNMYLFDWSEFSHGTNWVYLPSGLRLLLVLVLPLEGALGIAAASLVINYTFMPNAHVYGIVTSLIAGGAPFLARYLAIRFLQLNPFLNGLNSAEFFKISILFAITNATLHQVWFGLNGLTNNWLQSALVMGVGDWVGTVIVLALVSLKIKAYKLMLGPPKE